MIKDKMLPIHTANEHITHFEVLC